MYRILIVDDEPYTAHALSAMLEEALNEEAELYCAYSGAQALELLHSGRIDMLLCDVQMPGMTGLALSEEVRRCQPQCKIIVFTAYGEFDYAYRAMQLNCAAYILKSEPDEVIVKRIRKVLSCIDAERSSRLREERGRLRARHMTHYLLSQLLQEKPAGEELDRLLGLQQAPFCILLPLNAGERREKDICAALNAGNFSYVIGLGADNQPFYLIQHPENNIALPMHILEALEELHAGLRLRGEEELPSFLISPVLEETKAFSAAWCRLLSVAAEMAPGDSPCVRICPDGASADTFSSACNTVFFLREYIAEHITGDVSLMQLSARTGYNADYISRIFHRETGQRISDYISAQKISCVQRLMADESLGLDDIARAAGFSSRSYFNRFIKKMTGVTAQQYRRQCLQK